MRGALTYATKVAEARRGFGASRVEVLRLPDRMIFVVADGGAGCIGGASMADHVCGAVVEHVGEHGAPTSWSAWLRQLDSAMPRVGVTAAVLVEARADGRIVGASAGNCQAWLFTDGGTVELTRRQHAKLFLGEGRALPVSFDARAPTAVVVAATDELWRRVPRERVAAEATTRALDDAAAVLVDAARPRGGNLRHDVAVALCEISRGR